MMKARTLKISPVIAATLLGAPALGYSLAADAAATGNIGVFSKYVLRGMTNNSESDGPALQGGLDYSHASGIYAGYWGSSLDYTDAPGSDKCEEAGDCSAAGVENDFYAGYAGKAGEIDYNLGVIYYYYLDIGDSDAAEIAASVGYKGLTAGVKYLTSDVVWGNTGDMYWTLAYTASLPYDFKLGGTVGYYTYTKDGDFIAETADSKSSGFRHLDLKLSHPIGSTGADMGLTYVVGGKDRMGVNQADTIVFGISYAFDIAK